MKSITYLKPGSFVLINENGDAKSYTAQQIVELEKVISGARGAAYQAAFDGHAVIKERRVRTTHRERTAFEHPDRWPNFEPKIDGSRIRIYCQGRLIPIS